MSTFAQSTHFRNVRNTVQNFTSGIALVTGYVVTNTTAATVYMQIFDLDAASVTLGTTVPMLSFPVTATNVGSIFFGTMGVSFNTKMSGAVTTTVEGSADPGTGVFVQIVMR